MFVAGASTFAADPATSQEESETKSAFPTLDILPEGSILQRVRLPRYDKDFNPESLLTADKLTVIDSHRIDGENVTIELYGKDGRVQAHTEMEHAIYNQKNSTLHANESITLTGDDFQASGTGLIFHLKNTRGLLIGPATTEFNLNSRDTATAMQPILSPKVLTAALLTLTTSVMAEPPAKLTGAQLTELDTLTKPSTEALQKNQQETNTSLESEKQMIEQADATMKPFLKGIDQGALLIKTESPEAQKKSSPAPQAKPPNLLKVECDGGLYFDSETGVLAYLKNVRLNGAIVDEKNDPPSAPRPFRLTCSEELKVFLDKKPVEPKKPQAKPGDAPIDPDSTVNKAAKPPEEKKDKALSDSFGDFKRVIATGNVHVTSKDENGKNFIAEAETASYDRQSGEMILRGGLPRIQYGPNQFLESKAPGQYIRILKNGKLVTTGKWAMQIDTSQKKPKTKTP